MMKESVPWNSQPLAEWTGKHAAGTCIELNGRQTHYVEKGEGDPVVLVHGFYFDHHSWIGNLEPMAKEFKVYALDLWGFGCSTREPLDYGFELYAEQLRLFMEALAIERAHLVGHSMGGGTSILFSLKNRDKVRKLVLVDSAGIPAPIPLTGKIFQLPVLPEILFRLNTNSIRRRLLENNWIYNNELITDDYFDEVTRFQKIEGTTEGLLKILRKEFFHTLGEEIRELGQMDIPTLIIWGEKDHAVPLSSGQEMHRLLKGSRFELLQNAGHLSNFDAADRFNKLVLDFLRD